eukprot:TRINITY_DN11095_c0_g1_i2.p1 TRINITY_DN11095_c0_g1~~TRINITY_DN11095_c0_g1_i2.p1  ORF type:complete len:984 (+),score=371.88 TRINITY_DN11095_c0_g1_i2:418-3369(+)
MTVLEAPTPFPPGAYEVQWKRGGATGTTAQVQPVGNQLPLHHPVVIPNCITTYKEGKALKRYLTLAVVRAGDNVQVGQLKTLVSEFDGVPKGPTAEMMLDMHGDGQQVRAVLGITISMTLQAAEAVPQPQPRPPQQEAPPRQLQTDSDASGLSASGRKFPAYEMPSVPTNFGARAASPHEGDAGQPINPLESGLNARPDLSDQNIQVLVRVRPGDQPVWQTDVENARVTDDEKSHAFDHVFPMTAMNADIWGMVGPRFIDAVTTGLNGTIFMYGQTGSGKTHTMFGKDDEPGLTMMLFEKLFDRIRTLQDGNTEFSVQASYFEIYNEQLNDLLVSDVKKGRNLQIRQKQDHFIVPELVVHTVKDRDDCQQLLQLGGSKKIMGQSHLNQDSSRSHTIFSLHVKSEHRSGGKTVKKTATLNFCDLAGSESLNSEGDSGQKKETVNINKSLSFLKSVIQQLAKNEQVVYRNSSLTRILKQSLGGNAKTSVIITIHPGREQQATSRNSLWFGSMARTVKNRARVNEEIDEGALRAQIKRLQAELNARDQELETLHSMRDDYMDLRDQYETLCVQNDMLLNSTSAAGMAAQVHQAADKAAGLVPQDQAGQVPSAPVSMVSGAAAGSGQGGQPVVVDKDREERFLQRESMLLKQINGKDREIIDLKLAHSRELMEKTRQLTRALQEETAIELMQKDDRLDQLVHQILSYLHYGTKVLHVTKDSTTRVLMYLITQEGTQYICLSPLDANAKGLKETQLEKICVKDIRKIVLGQYGAAFDKHVGGDPQKNLPSMFDQSFSIKSEKGKKRLDVVAETPSDFEAWIQSLNHLSPVTKVKGEYVKVRAEWGAALPKLSDFEEFDQLDSDEAELCSSMHIPPIDYLNARSQVLNKEGRFVTLFDVRTLSCLDMYHSQKLFAFFMQKGWIGQRKIHFLDTEKISKANLYVVTYESDDNTSSVPPPAPSHHHQYARPLGAVKGPPNPTSPPPSASYG